MTDGSTTAGQIIVKFIADTAGFEAGYNKVDSSLVKFGQESADATSQAKDLQKQTENAGKAAKATAKETEELADSMGKQSDAASDAASATEDAGDEIERTGEKAKTARDDILGLDEVANKLKNSLGILALGGAIMGAVEWMIELQDKAVKTQRGFQILYGDIDKATDALYRYRDAERSIVGGDEESRSRTYEAVSRAFGDEFAGTEYGEQLVQQLVSYGDLGIDGAQTAYQLGEIMNKWKIPLDKAIETLNLIVGVSKEQYGPISENARENMAVLTQYDPMLQAMGLTDINDAAKYLLALDSRENMKGVLDPTNTIYREWTAGMSDIAAAEELVPVIEKEIQGVKQEISLNGDEDGSLKQKLDELTDKLMEALTISKLSPGDLLKTVLAGETYSGIQGRDKDEFLSIAKIVRNADSVQLPEVTNEATKVEKTWSEKAGTFFANFADITGDQLIGLVEDEAKALTNLENVILRESIKGNITTAIDPEEAFAKHRAEQIIGTGNTRKIFTDTIEDLLVDVYGSPELVPKELYNIGYLSTLSSLPLPANTEMNPLLGEGPSEEVTDAYSDFTETVSKTAGVFENMETTSKNVNDNIRDEEGICYDTAIQMQTLADATNNAAEAQERFNRAMEGATSNAGYNVSTSIVSASRGGAGT